MLLKQRTLKKIPEVVACDVDLLLRTFGDIAAAPQQIADPPSAGGVALSLPELYLPGVAVQHYHLPNAHEVTDGIDILPHRDRCLFTVDLHGDRHTLKGHIQPQFIRAAAVQVLADRLDAFAAEYPHRSDHVAGSDPAVADTDGFQLRRPSVTFLYILAEIACLYNAGAVKHPLQIHGTARRRSAHGPRQAAGIYSRREGHRINQNRKGADTT